MKRKTGNTHVMMKFFFSFCILFACWSNSFDLNINFESVQVFVTTDRIQHLI